MVAAAMFTFLLDTASASFQLLLSVGAGTGLLYLLRWFWWRISAWSEIAAMASSFLIAVGFFAAGRMGHAVPAHIALIVTVAATSVLWIAVTFLAPPPDRATLVSFYQKVRPAGPGWTSVRAEAGGEASPDSLSLALLGWVLGCVFVYAALFGTGSFLYGRTGPGLMWLGLFAASGAALLKLLPRLWSRSEG